MLRCRLARRDFSRQLGIARRLLEGNRRQEPFALGVELAADHDDTTDDVEPDQQHDQDSARVLIDEAHLFIEAVHACYNRIRTEGAEAA